jgi:hypothetical protein
MVAPSVENTHYARFAKIARYTLDMIPVMQLVPQFSEAPFLMTG